MCICLAGDRESLIAKENLPNGYIIDDPSWRVTFIAFSVSDGKNTGEIVGEEGQLDLPVGGLPTSGEIWTDKNGRVLLLSKDSTNSMFCVCIANDDVKH